MTLSAKIVSELKRLAGYDSETPATVVLAGADGVELAIDLTVVDSMSCSFREVRASVPSLADSGIETLKKWAEALSRRVTYLLENLGPVEFDPEHNHVLIRSTPPDRQADGVHFYEILLQSHGAGHFTLRRFRAENGASGRHPIDMQATHEVLRKLLVDLIETVPAA